MRFIDHSLQAELDSGTTTLCRCWRLTRRDGAVLGFTDHDMDLTFEDCLFRAATGLDASALQSANGLSVDNAQAIGALSDTAISEADIRTGRYDRAEVDHWLVDWRDPSRRVHLFRGTLGEIKRTEYRFEAELRGLADALNAPVGRSLLRACDRVVGDAKCGVNLLTPRFSLTTETVEEDAEGQIVGLKPGDFDDGWFDRGVLRWLSGANAGLAATVQRDRAIAGRRVLSLAQKPSLPVAKGDRFVLTAGCDKRAGTCREKFSNFLNFCGFPHIPGEDWIFAYPKSGESHDGSSLWPE